MKNLWQKLTYWLAVLLLAIGGLGGVLTVIGLLFQRQFADIADNRFDVDPAGIVVLVFFAFIASMFLIFVGLMMARYNDRLPYPSIGVVVLPIFFIIAFVVLAPALVLPGHRHHRNSCTSNQRQIALAINMYCTENGETMPGKAGLAPESSDADKQYWRTHDIQGIPSGVFDCKYNKRSGAPGPGTADYAMNADIMGIKLDRIPVQVATLLTADTKGTDAIFSAKDIDPRHNGGFIASFVDGHVSYFNAVDIPHDPEANRTALGAPSTNKILIQGATNVIEVKLKGVEWANPSCTVYTGNPPASTRNRAMYISAYYAQVPSANKNPKDLTIGTLVNRPGTPPSPITLPVPAGASEPWQVASRYYTFRLPPGVYKMTGKGVKSVTVAPARD